MMLYPRCKLAYKKSLVNPKTVTISALEGRYGSSAFP